MTVSSVCQIVFSGKIILGELNGCGGEKGSNELENAALNKVKVMVSKLKLSYRIYYSLCVCVCVCVLIGIKTSLERGRGR